MTTKSDDFVNDGIDTDEFDFDSLDFETTDEVDFGETDNKREAVAPSSINVSEVISSVISPQTVATIGSKIGEEFTAMGDVYSGTIDTVSDLSRMKDDMLDEISPSINQAKRAARMFLPRVAGMVPNKLHEKLTKLVADTDDEGTASVESQRDSAISDQLASVFEIQSEQDHDTAVNEKTDRLIDQRLDGFRHTESVSVLQQIRNVLKSNQLFMSGMFRKYLMKSLDLKYRHLFATQDILAIAKSTMGLLEKRLSEVSKNTGLPDVVKKRKSEAAMESLREKGMSAMGDSLLSSTSEFRSKLMTNVKERLADKITGGVNSMVGGVSDMAVGQMEMDDMADDFGEKKVSAGTKGVAFILRKLLVDTGLVTLKAGAGSQKFDDLEEIANNIKDNMRQKIQHATRSSDSSTMVGGLLSAVVPVTDRERGRVVNAYESSGASDVGFDVATRKSIIDVIPGYLAKILQATTNIQEAVVSASRTGLSGDELSDFDSKVNAQELVFDKTTESFISADRFREKMDEDFFGTQEDRTRAMGDTISLMKAGFVKHGGELSEFNTALPNIVKVVNNLAKHDDLIAPANVVKYLQGDDLSPSEEEYLDWMFKDIQEGIRKDVASLLVKSFYKPGDLSSDDEFELSDAPIELDRDVMNPIGSMISTIGRDRDRYVDKLTTFAVHGNRRYAGNVLSNRTDEENQSIADRVAEEYQRKYSIDEMEKSVALQGQMQQEISNLQSETGVNNQYVRDKFADIDYDKLQSDTDGKAASIQSEFEERDANRETLNQGEFLSRAGTAVKEDFQEKLSPITETLNKLVPDVSKLKDSKIGRLINPKEGEVESLSEDTNIPTRDAVQVSGPGLYYQGVDRELHVPLDPDGEIKLSDSMDGEGLPDQRSRAAKIREALSKFISSKGVDVSSKTTLEALAQSEDDAVLSGDIDASKGKSATSSHERVGRVVSPGKRTTHQKVPGIKATLLDTIRSSIYAKKFVDVFVTDSVDPENPLIKGADIENGKIMFADGTILVDSLSITEPCYRVEDERLVVSVSDLRSGLVDSSNRPLKATFIQKVISKVKSHIAAMFGVVKEKAVKVAQENGVTDLDTAKQAVEWKVAEAKRSIASKYRKSGAKKFVDDSKSEVGAVASELKEKAVKVAQENGVTDLDTAKQAVEWKVAEAKRDIASKYRQSGAKKFVDDSKSEVGAVASELKEKAIEVAQENGVTDLDTAKQAVEWKVAEAKRSIASKYRQSGAKKFVDDSKSEVGAVASELKEKATTLKEKAAEVARENGVTDLDTAKQAVEWKVAEAKRDIASKYRQSGAKKFVDDSKSEVGAVASELKEKAIEVVATLQEPSWFGRRAQVPSDEGSDSASSSDVVVEIRDMVAQHAEATSAWFQMKISTDAQIVQLLSQIGAGNDTESVKKAGIMGRLLKAPRVIFGKGISGAKWYTTTLLNKYKKVAKMVKAGALATVKGALKKSRIYKVAKMAKTAASKVASAAAGYTGWVADKYSRGFGAIRGGITKIGGAMLASDKYADVYRKDEVQLGKPLIKGDDVKAGKIIFKSGAVLKNSLSISEPCYMGATKRLVISAADIEAGLVNYKNKPLKGSIAKAILKAAWGGIKGAVGVGKYLAKKGIAAVAGIASRIRSISPFRKRRDGVDSEGGMFTKRKDGDKVTVAILQRLVTAHLVTITKLLTPISKKVTGGIREGGFIDHKNDKAEVANRKGNKKRVAKTAKSGGMLRGVMGGKSEEDDSSGGIISAALGGAAAYAGSAVLSGAASVVSAGASTIASGAGTAALALASNPIGWAILGTLAVGAAGYGVYRYFKGKKGKMKMAGIRNVGYRAPSDKMSTMYKLEYALYNAKKDGEEVGVDALRGYSDDFGLDPNNVPKFRFFMKWYRLVFQPVFRDGLNILLSVFQKDLPDQTDLSKEQIEKYATLMSGRPIIKSTLALRLVMSLKGYEASIRDEREDAKSQPTVAKNLVKKAVVAAGTARLITPFNSPGLPTSPINAPEVATSPISLKGANRVDNPPALGATDMFTGALPAQRGSTVEDHINAEKIGKVDITKLGIMRSQLDVLTAIYKAMTDSPANEVARKYSDGVLSKLDEILSGLPVKTEANPVADTRRNVRSTMPKLVKPPARNSGISVAKRQFSFS